MPAGQALEWVGRIERGLHELDRARLAKFLEPLPFRENHGWPEPVLGGVRLRAFLGGGGFGLVFRGERDGETVAVKGFCSKHPFTAEQEARYSDRFALEAELGLELGGVGVVRVLEGVQVEQGRQFFTMEYIGRSAQEWRRAARDRLLPEDHVRRVALGVVRGLERLHGAGVLHRDLKPANILIPTLTSNIESLAETIPEEVSSAGGLDDAKLADLGLAKRTEENRTGYLAMMGTRGFLPPEGGSVEWSPSADIFSMGVTLYCLLSDGEPPFGTDGEAIGRAMFGSYLPISEFRSDLSEEMCAIVERCLQPEWADRFRDAAALRRALENMGCDGVHPKSTVQPPTDGRLQRVREARERADPKGLRDLATQAHQLSDPALLRLVAAAQSELVEYEDGEQSWRMLLEICPGDLDAQLSLSTALARQGSLEESNKILQDVLDRETSPLRQAEPLALLARNSKLQWQQRWKAAEDPPLEALRAAELRQSAMGYLSAFERDEDHFYSGLNALSLTLVEIELAVGAGEEWVSMHDGSVQRAMLAVLELQRRATTLSRRVRVLLGLKAQLDASAPRADPWLAASRAHFVFLDLELADSEAVAAAYRAFGYLQSEVRDSEHRQLQVYRELGLWPERVRVACEVLEELL